MLCIEKEVGAGRLSSSFLALIFQIHSFFHSLFHFYFYLFIHLLINAFIFTHSQVCFLLYCVYSPHPHPILVSFYEHFLCAQDCVECSGPEWDPCLRECSFPLECQTPSPILTHGNLDRVLAVGLGGCPSGNTGHCSFIKRS